MPVANGIDVFWGPADDTAARLFVRCHWEGEVSGVVRGPFSVFSKTLPMTMPLHATDDERGGITYSAQVLDPCFWTPELPLQYRLRLEIRASSGTVQTCEMPIGIRRFEPFRRSLLMNGRRRVIRGTVSDSSLRSSLEFYRENSLCLMLDSPADAICQEASELGVLMIARLGRAADAEAELRRVARFPAVAMAILNSAPSTLDRPTTGSDVIIAAEWTPGGPVPPWARAVVCEAGRLQAATDQELDGLPIPVLATRPLRSPTEANAARQACDNLQRDLAPRFDLAGYLV